ncbi:GbsR/MarR family transcriptional regulator [Flavobacterium adhaerens]|uniref:GbsR/MarR family transcriptional regulator n=1 Tax=Flavobacterium adhaerens TaxID=3149043 RepID=UPI0032B50F19
MEDLQKEKEELIEMFGIHFESIYNVPPLAARIMGLLILDGCKQGLTFEDIVTKIGASKSSVSTNLHLLLNSERIYYHTFAGDRRKYFKAAPFSNRLANYIKVINHEKELIDKLTIYRSQTMSCKQESHNLEHAKAYKSYVQNIEDILLKSIEEFKEIEKKS